MRNFGKENQIELKNQDMTLDSQTVVEPPYRKPARTMKPNVPFVPPHARTQTEKNRQPDIPIRNRPKFKKGKTTGTVKKRVAKNPQATSQQQKEIAQMSTYEDMPRLAPPFSKPSRKMKPNEGPGKFAPRQHNL